MIKPDKIKLANLPTPIFEFNKFNNSPFTKLFIKRDDFTGMEMSGNKVRKLEFSLGEGLRQNADIFITCGGIQSNHCRATASASCFLGKKSHLVLRGEEESADGNLFLDKMFGAEITFISSDDYKYKRNEIMEEIKEGYKKQGLRAYILPEGASNGIGMFGYFECFEEILSQERELGISFDCICSVEGSAGTYAGLYAANEIYGTNKKIVGFNIYDKNADVKIDVVKIIEEGLQIASYSGKISYDNICIFNDYAGDGYGITNGDTVEFIKDTATKTGIVFDPVYTGKGLHGMIQEIENKNEIFKGNVLFIHTGGLFGTFPKKGIFNF